MKGLDFTQYMRTASYGTLAYIADYRFWRFADLTNKPSAVTVDLDGLPITFTGDIHLSINDMFDETFDTAHNFRVQGRAAYMPPWALATPMGAWRPRFVRVLVRGRVIATFDEVRPFACNFGPRNITDFGYKSLRVFGTWLEFDYRE